MTPELIGMWLQVASTTNKCIMGRSWNLPALHLHHNLVHDNEAILLAV